MSSLKTYLIVVSVLLLIAIGFGVYVWYRIQTLDLEPQEVLPSQTMDEEVLREALPEKDTHTDDE